MRAVKLGGIIRFRCGPDPVTIVMKRTAKVVNTSKKVVLDGEGLVTLSGDGKRRILYQNTCDPDQIWTTDHCQDQATPELVVQNLRFVRGNSTGQTYEGGGGGAIFARGGQLKIVDTVFDRNRCDRHGPDVGGAAVRALSQFHNRPVYVVGSTFRRGVCSNGGGLSSIGVSWSVYNSTFTDNRAVGTAPTRPRRGTRGGGTGGAIYNDGNKFRLFVAGTTMTGNHANEGGGAIFYVSNDRSGTLAIRWSTLEKNPSDRFETLPGIYFLGQVPLDHALDRALTRSGRRGTCGLRGRCPAVASRAACPRRSPVDAGEGSGYRRHPRTLREEQPHVDRRHRDAQGRSPDVARLFTEFERSSTTPARKRTIVKRVIELLTVHTYLENEVMYPEVRAWSPTSRTDVLESYEEHHVADVLCLPSSSRWTPSPSATSAKFTVLIENVRHHVEEEEQDWFPQVRAALSRTQLREMGARMLDLRPTAPTKPYPAERPEEGRRRGDRVTARAGTDAQT